MGQNLASWVGFVSWQRLPVFTAFWVVLLLLPPVICFLQLFCRRDLLQGESVGSALGFSGVNRILLLDRVLFVSLIGCRCAGGV